jgi:serine protease inhibitor
MQKLDSIRDVMTLQAVAVQIPKFEFEIKDDLIDLLESLGVHDALAENDADFKGMTDEQAGKILFMGRMTDPTK